MGKEEANLVKLWATIFASLFTQHTETEENMLKNIEDNTF
jgi:hypothetical protein